MNVLEILLSQAVAESLAQEMVRTTDCTPEKAADVLNSNSVLELTPGVQQMLFTLEALVHQKQRKGGYRDSIMTSMNRWLGTQKSDLRISRSGIASNPVVTRKLDFDESHLEAMVGSRQLMSPSANENRSPLALQRLTPLLALLPMYPSDVVQSIALHSAQMTDGHLEVRQTVIELFAELSNIVYGNTSWIRDSRNRFHRADPDKLGDGMTARSVYLNALWCTLNVDKFSELVLLAVTRPGDKVAIAGLAGVLWCFVQDLGAPSNYVERLEHASLIYMLVQQYQTENQRSPA